MIGGVEAVAWTDASQVIVLIGFATTVQVLTCVQLPYGDHQYLLRMQLENSNWDQAFDLRQSILWTVMIATVFTKITTYCTDQTIVQRYLTTKTVKNARRSLYLSATMTVLVTVLFFLVETAIWGNLRYHCQYHCQYHCANIS